MARRYRITPGSDQEEILRVHCAHARFVWNLAFELSRWGTLETYGEASRRTREDGTTYIHQKRRPVRPRPGFAAQCVMLTGARREFGWLRAGSSSVQAQALRDFDQAMSAFFDPDNPARHPAPRGKRGTQGFVIRDTRARRVSRNVGEVYVPKCGWVRFRWSRDLPAKPGMARVTLDTAGRGHVSFPAPPRSAGCRPAQPPGSIGAWPPLWSPPAGSTSARRASQCGTRTGTSPCNGSSAGRSRAQSGGRRRGSRWPASPLGSPTGARTGPRR